MRHATLLIALLLIACGNEEPRAAAPVLAPAPTSIVAIATPTATAALLPSRIAPRREQVVVFLGDSLTAGLGLSADEAWPTLVAEKLAAAGTPIRAVNAGVSGDTSAGGLRRLAWLLKQQPDVVVVELGANDGLRGQPVAGIEANLREIVERSRATGARVLLLGLQMPPSLGSEYTRQFADLYPRIARDLDVSLVPFLLAGVAGDPELNLPDGIHPNAEGQRRVAELVRPHLEAVLAAEAEPARAAR